MFGVVWDKHSSHLKVKQYKQNTSPKSYKIEIKFLADPELALNNPYALMVVWPPDLSQPNQTPFTS